MRKHPRLWGLAAVLVIAAALASTIGIASARAASCASTGFFRDGIDLTAAQIGGNVTSALDATTCNIGVYYGPGTTGTVSGANISGANYYGVVVDRAAVNVTGSSIHDIGETPLNGTQHGVGVLYTTIELTSDPSNTVFSVAGAATGTLSGTTFTNYQKGGAVVTGAGVSVTVQNNVVTGQGPVDYIAQNGIQVSYGANATVTGNTVTGNAYTGGNQASSGGIIVVGGACFGANRPYTVGLSITRNTLTGNDVGVWLSNGDASCNAPSTATNNSVKLNTISNGAVTNTTGYSATCGYQAGIADLGKKDLIVNNTISGTGYTPQTPDCSGTPPAFLRNIDLTTKARGVPSNK
jgi:hypothetical protein